MLPRTVVVRLVVIELKLAYYEIRLRRTDRLKNLLRTKVQILKQQRQSLCRL